MNQMRNMMNTETGMENEGHLNKSADRSFVEDGFEIIKNAIRPEIIHKTQQIVNRTISELAKDLDINLAHNVDDDRFFNEGMLNLIKHESPFELLIPVWKNLSFHGMPREIFLETRVYKFISDILGKDICHQDDPALTLNLPGLSSPNQNYLFKAFHQEVWSGADVNTIQFWTPIFKSKNCGGLVLVPGSHLWGHIPHRNREPIELPKGTEEFMPDIEIGDVIIFHSLLLHGSNPIDGDGQPVLAMPCLLKNFRLQNQSFECFKNWRNFSYSDLSKIDRRLGNHYLSPFRLLNVDKPKFDRSIS